MEIDIIGDQKWNNCNACKGFGFWLAAGLIYSKKSAQSVNFEKIMSLSCAKERTQGK